MYHLPDSLEPESAGVSIMGGRSYVADVLESVDHCRSPVDSGNLGTEARALMFLPVDVRSVDLLPLVIPSLYSCSPSPRGEVSYYMMVVKSCECPFGVTAVNMHGFMELMAVAMHREAMDETSVDFVLSFAGCFC